MIGACLLLILATLILLLAKGLYPADLPQSRDPLGQAEDEVDFWRRSALASQLETMNLRDRLKQSEEAIDGLERL